MKTFEATNQTLEKDKLKQTDKHWDWHPTGKSPKPLLPLLLLHHN